MASDSSNEVVFESSDGATLDIDGSTVDLSALIAAGSAGVEADPDDATSVLLPIEPGTYDRIKIEFMRQAQIKGCVSANFSDGSLVPGVHTYCTQAAGSSFLGAATTNATFEDTVAEWMGFDINVGGDSYFTTDATEKFTTEYKIGAKMEITADTATSLTFAIDMNRLLRYYNMGRSDTGSGPTAPKDKTYFFDSTFRGSTFAFVGKPGSIYGYEMLALACADANYDATTKLCTDTFSPVALWMTLITDPDGKPVIANFMPDDDNTLTVVKGGSAGLDSWATENAATYDFRYTLGEGDVGTILGLPVDLNSTAIDTGIDGVTFDGFQDMSGPVTTTRRL